MSVNRKVVLAVGLGMMGLCATSNAALMLDINNGATVITDNGAGDSDTTVGRIAHTELGASGYSLAISLAVSNSPGTSAAGILQLNSLAVQAGANPASLDLRVSDTDFSLPGSGGSPMVLQSSIGGTFTGGAIGNSVTFQSYADPANGQPASAVSTPMLTFTKALPLLSEAFSGQNAVNWNRAAGAYSLADHLVVTLSANGQVQVSGATNATEIPEPATLGLFGAGVLGLLVRRRRN